MEEAVVVELLSELGEDCVVVDVFGWHGVGGGGYSVQKRERAALI